MTSLNLIAPQVGLEPTTYGLTVRPLLRVTKLRFPTQPTELPHLALICFNNLLL